MQENNSCMVATCLVCAGRARELHTKAFYSALKRRPGSCGQRASVRSASDRYCN